MSNETKKKAVWFSPAEVREFEQLVLTGHITAPALRYYIKQLFHSEIMTIKNQQKQSK